MNFSSLQPCGLLVLSLFKNSGYWALFTVLFLLPQMAEAQHGSEWIKGKLRWRHFLLVEDDDEIYKANLSYRARDLTDTIDKQIVIDFRIQVDTVKTWVKEGHLNRNLLNHERTHFNIAELELRKLKQLIKEQPLLMLQYDSLLQATRLREDAIQEQFERETAYGTNIDRNRAWHKATNKALRKLKAYKGPVYLRILNGGSPVP